MSATKEFAERLDKISIGVILHTPINTFDRLMRWMVTSPVATYYKNGSKQCRNGRNRSISDICLTARYNLGMSSEDAIKALGRWVSEHYNKILIFYCPQVRKLVFSSYPTGNFGFQSVRSTLLNSTNHLENKSGAFQRLAGLALLENIR